MEQGAIFGTKPETCNLQRPGESNTLFYCVPRHSQYKTFEERHVLENYQKQFNLSKSEMATIEDL